MRLATREEVYDIDKDAVEKYGLSLHQLIEKSGQALVRQIEKIFLQEKWDSKSRIGVWCGKGHNGEDGRVTARLLQEKNFNVQILEGASWSPADFQIIIDALFGVGLNRPLEGPVKEQILRLNASRKIVLAVDLPSGIDANTGSVWGCAVKARWTLAIAPAKPGLFLNEGPSHAGKVRRVEIGFPPELIKEKAQSVFLIGAASARKLLPSRPSGANKTHFGHVLVIAGASGMEGAGLLVSEAAARMGCGYVTLCSPSAEIYQQARPDFLRLDLESFFKDDLRKYTAVVVGPGLGVNSQTHQILDHLLKHHEKVVVDADALTVLSQKTTQTWPSTWILTPHAGELSRILGVPARELESDRLKSVERAQNRLNTLVLFKGFRTVLGHQGKRFIIGSGNVALAKAGSGDVLAGFIGSLLAQGLSSEKAAALGAYLHGRIADDWLRRAHSARTFMASDLPELIDASLRGLKKGL